MADVDLRKFVIPAAETDPVFAIIARRRRQILVHSVLYYALDAPVISDHEFDQWCRELVKLQATYPDQAAHAPHAAAFADFTGSTGFDLPLDAPASVSRALEIVSSRSHPRPAPSPRGPRNRDECPSLEQRGVREP